MTPERVKELKAEALRVFEEAGGSEFVIWQILHGSQGSGYQGEEGVFWGCIAAEMERRWRQDAERYRWLKANHLQTGPDSWIRTGDDLEEAIDAAMQSRP